MAGVVGKLIGKRLLTLQNGLSNSKATFTSFRALPRTSKVLLVSSGAVTVGGAALIYALEHSIKADAGWTPKIPHYSWSHEPGKFSIASLDHASIRRGYEVYKQVCAACHSLQYVAYAMLIGVTHTEEEAKAEAEQVQIQDGPDDQGNMFMRPGKLSDYFPSPYPNEEAARAANNGANPPDLSLIIFARHHGEDYVFSLLTGYCDPPEGVEIREGLHFNPYFPGGSIGMARALYNEVIEYSDGTPATASQMAKDIVTFLRWTSEPYHDDRKKKLIKAMMILVPLTVVSWFFYRRTWSPIKNRKIGFRGK